MMKFGFLSRYFQGIAIKRLSAVEADTTRSNQHEYNATRPMLDFMGRPANPTQVNARFMRLTDDPSDSLVEDGFLTLYDCRKGQKGRHPEYRFYFPTTAVSRSSSEGDLLVIARRRGGDLLVIVAEKEGSISRRIKWLFGFQEEEVSGFLVKTGAELEKGEIGYAARIVLDSIGIEFDLASSVGLEDLLREFGGGFPSSVDFSRFARSSTPDVDPVGSPDTALLAWMEREEVLFRILEKHLLKVEMNGVLSRKDFDPDPILKIAMSAFQRRKSRAGSALENHLEEVFRRRKLTFTRTPVTEGRLKPDFIFPDIQKYRDSSFSTDRLTMLAAKTTSKDRWRQILNEAERIPEKHLFTLEPGISENQTAEMISEGVRLVVPGPLHETYSSDQRRWILNLESFLDLLAKRQKATK